LTNNRELALGLAALALIIAAVWLFSGRTADSPELASNPSTTPAAEAIAITNDTSSDEPAAVPDETSSTNDNTTLAAIPTNNGNSIYIPVVSYPIEENPQTAVIQHVTGSVQVQIDGSTWKTITTNNVLSAGQRIRTGDLSQATLTFYDGSQAHLRANTEISIDELNALRPEDGFRTVVLTQWLGDSDHQVAHRGDNGSRYEVKTAEGSGIARGTQFHVTVLPNQLARYIVNEGKVDVSSFNKTVSVTAGQVTTLLIGSPPESPAFTITGQGQVSAIGSEWAIAGQTFGTHPLTLIVGNPQVGDLVHVEGHLLEDGSRVADRIILLRRAVTNQFSLTGEVSAIGSDWTVSGQAIATTAQTVIDDDILVGDTVRVEGLILEDGTLQAQTIRRLEDAPGLPFQFSGIVQVMNEGSWVISGQTVVLDGETAVDPAIALGNTVSVRGWIREDSTWLATNISLLADDLPTFDFTGTITSIDPWIVAGISFTTGNWTTISPDLVVGDAVRVRGTILSDGTWAADSISRLNDTLPNIVTFVGLVSSIDPWIVNGLPLVVTGSTTILGDITPGMMAVVTAQLLPDGTWTVLTIRPLYPDFGQGCLTFSSPVVMVNGDILRVKHWKLDIKRDGRIKIHGDIKANSIITLPICTGWDGTIIIIGDIVVIYQPIIVIINPGNNIPDGCRLTSKGSIKCSNKGSKHS
ncbi:MAG: FecR domain-containing protein, partial [Anaerolineae bacterium]|nr:FecR domain-containing protein [Anaerolineae bacterium]